MNLIKSIIIECYSTFKSSHAIESFNCIHKRQFYIKGESDAYLVYTSVYRLADYVEQEEQEELIILKEPCNDTKRSQLSNAVK